MTTIKKNPALDSYPLERRVESIWIDFQMLKEGQWQPDDDSVEASVENIEIIFRELKRLGVISPDYKMEYNVDDSDYTVVVD